MQALELLVPAVVVFLADQLAKWLVARHLPKGQSLLFARWLEIRYTTKRSEARRGARPRFALLLLWCSTAIILILFVQQGELFRHVAARTGLGAALGGAAGNLYDRMRRGAVIDLLKVGWWPVFNLADVAITFGATAALLFMR